MTVKKKAVVKTKSQMPAKTKEVEEVVSTEVIIASVENRAKKPFAQLKKFDKITSQEDLATASTQMKLVKELGKEAKKQMDDITNPLENSINQIKQLFKPFSDKIKLAETNLKIAIDVFIEDNNKKLEKVKEDFKNGKVKKVSTFTEKTSELQIISAGAAKIRKITKMFITNEKKIPDKFWIVDESAVEAALKSGEVVPGAELRKVNNVAI